MKASPFSPLTVISLLIALSLSGLAQAGGQLAVGGRRDGAVQAEGEEGGSAGMHMVR